MSFFEWHDIDVIEPKEGEIVNIWAKSIIDGEYRQFMAKYTSFKSGGKKHHVFSGINQSDPFMQKGIYYWCGSLPSPYMNTWKYVGD